MNIEDYRNFCLSFKEVTEDFPFDNKTLVFKVLGKMFALLDVDKFESVNLKCDPERAITLREEYDGIQPGYHMNKKHWNTVSIYSDVNSELLKTLTSHSYDMVVKGLPKSLRTQLSSSN